MPSNTATKAKASATKTTKATAASTTSTAARGRPKVRGTPLPGNLTKISVSLPTELVEAVSALPGTGNFSRVVATALVEWQARARLGHLVDEWLATHGPIPPEVQAQVDEEWRDL